MSLITVNDLAPFRRTLPTYEFSAVAGKVVRGASKRLLELSAAATSSDRFDIFLSHKFSDAEQLLALYELLRSMGYSVYVDWIDDTELDRSRVTPATAKRLRSRMDQSRCLFFATTSTSSESKWMPWELGYVDGKKNGRSAICPVVVSASAGFVGQEYLGVYPYVDKTGKSLWIHRSPDKYVSFDAWLKGENPAE